jgi:gamma-glutamylcyclotransferase
MNLVFAFGSNMHTRQMFTRCPSAKLLGPGLLRNYRLGFGGGSRRWNGAVATIVQAPGKRCFGLLFEITDTDLARLDVFEGTPYVYERITVPVRHGEGRSRRAFAYRLKDRAPGYPAAAYLALIWDAYRSWGFDANGIAEALEEGCRGKEHLRQAHAIALRMISTTSRIA